MVTRIGGLSTGMDIDSLVGDLMKANRIPVDRLKQKRQVLEWQRDSYRQVNSQILDYRLNKLSNFRLEGTFLSKKATLTGNTTAVSAKVTSTSQTGTLSVKADNLAEAASKWSSADIRTADKTFDPSKALADQDVYLTGDFSKSTYTIKINDFSIDVDTTKDSLNDVMRRISEKTNVSAYYDTDSGKISFIAKETGTINGAAKDGDYITFEDDSGLLAGSFGIDTAVNDATNSKAAVNATVYINGLQTTRTSNTFSVNGVEVTLLAPGGGTSTTIQVSSDTDKVVDSIKQFIADYNELLSSLQDKQNEARYRDFLPLTDEQKIEMNDKDIAAWEEKAKSGMLKNDPTIRQAVTSLRSSISAQVETGDPVYKTLSSIGIETGQYFENGKLYLFDESKLRTALEQKPDAVKALFTSTGNGDADRSDVGIAGRMYSDLKNTLDQLSKKAGSSALLNDHSFLGKGIDRLSRDITSRSNRLGNLENRYYAQFTAMEKAIQRYNMQSAYLANAFGGGQQ
jgi:flagellar hook-associated protein 2